MTAPEPAFREDFQCDQDARSGSERAFGRVSVLVFTLIALWPLIKGVAPQVWTFALAAAIAVVALVWPQLPAATHRAWFRFGLVLQRILSPIVPAFLFFCSVTTLGLPLRFVGKAPRQPGFDRNARSYRMERQPPGPAPGTFRRQF